MLTNSADIPESTIYQKGTFSKDDASTSIKPTTIALGNNATNQTVKETQNKSHKKRCKSSYNKIAQVSLYHGIILIWLA